MSLFVRTPPAAARGAGGVGDCADPHGPYSECIDGNCVHTPDDGACDNGAWCDGAERCDAVSDCQAGTPVDCGDGVSCTVDVDALSLL